MDYELFVPLFHKIDGATSVFIQDISSKAITELTPVLTVGLTLSFIIYSLLIIQGLIETPITQFLAKCLRIVVILGIASIGGLYQSHIAGVICTLPDDLASILITNPPQGATAASLIDQASAKGCAAMGEAFNKAGFLSHNGVIYAVFGVIIGITTVFLIGIGGSFLLLAKVALALLTGLGPFFIVALLFDATKRFFELWLVQIMNYVILVVLFSAVFGLMMDMFGTYMASLKLDGVQNTGYSLGGAAILAYSMIIILRQLPGIASGISQGVSLNAEPLIRTFSKAGHLLSTPLARKGAVMGNKAFSQLSRTLRQSRGARRFQGHPSPERAALPPPSYGYAQGSLGKEAA